MTFFKEYLGDAVHVKVKCVGDLASRNCSASVKIQMYCLTFSQPVTLTLIKHDMLCDLKSKLSCSHFVSHIYGCVVVYLNLKPLSPKTDWDEEKKLK